MTRKEHLEFCEKCTNRDFDFNQGITCGLTKKIADFEGNCPNFNLDETVKEESTSKVDLENGVETISIEADALEKLRTHQDFYYALIGGSLAAIVSAVIWAIITVTTQYQIGYMAIGVGLLVGFSVRFFGAGIDKKFGYLGSTLSLLGCLLGNLLSQIGFIAEEQSLGYMETISYLDLNMIMSIMMESFQVMDILFYGFAIYEGYKFAFRNLTHESLAELKKNNYEVDLNHYKIRMYLVIGSIVVLASVFYFVSQGTDGSKTFYYESGNKLSEGNIENNKETGFWTYYYENGNIQSTGYFIDGLQDSTWLWYYESGGKSKFGNYEKGVEHGIWINYYENGVIKDSGDYHEGRMNGLWVFKYESGKILQKGQYDNNIPIGSWSYFYENGTLKSKGNMSNGTPIENWVTYYDNGQLNEEISYSKSGEMFFENVWDKEGNQLVTNRNGMYKSFSDMGKVILSGEIKDGLKIGKWQTFFENGKIREEGEFKNDIYLIHNLWNIEGVQTVKEGNGNYVSYYIEDGAIYETGEIKDGLRNGLWNTFYQNSGELLQEVLYRNGKLNGLQTYFFEAGGVYLSGNMIEDLKQGEWNWYYENGRVSSTATFVNDVKEGKQLMYSEVGDIVKEEVYKNGKLVNI